jgi:aryl-alcohol dehydrogenase-like predicted oxidoreductase
MRSDQFAKLQYTAEKNGWTKFVSMQNHYSLLYREEEREMNKLCQETGVGLIPWGPLYAGYLARPLEGTGDTSRAKSSPRNLSNADMEIIKRVIEIAQKKGWSQSQVALAWIIQKGTVPIVGFSNLKRLDEAVKVKGKTLTEEEIKYLEEPYQPKPIMGHS